MPSQLRALRLLTWSGTVPNNAQYVVTEGGLQQDQLMQARRSEVANLDRERQLRNATPDPTKSLTSRNSEAKVIKWHVTQAEASNLRGIIDAFVNTCQRWRLNHDERMILLGYRPHDVIGQQVLAGRVIPSSQDVEDRVGCVVGISLGLGTVFGESINAEIGWIRKPRAKLNDKTAIAYMLEGHMVNLFIIDEMVKHERGL